MDENRTNESGMLDEDESIRRLQFGQQRNGSEVVQRISREAMAQWQKAMTGLIAFPAAIALGWASVAMSVALFLERGFAVFQEQTGQTLGRMGGELEEAGRNTDRQRLYERSGPTNQPRA